MKSRTRTVLIQLIGGCASLGFLGCDKAEFKPPPPPAVTVATPVQREVTDYAEFTGSTAAFTQTDLYARVSGYLQSVHFNGSDDVKQDQILFTIEQDGYIAARDKAQGEWQSRQAELKLATDKYNAIKKAHDNDSATELELWQAEANVKLATGNLASAKASLDLAELDLSYTEVKAPFDGKISEAMVDPGNLIGDGDRTRLATLIQYKPMHVYFDVPEREVIRVLAKRDGRLGDENQRQSPPLTLTLADNTELPETGNADYADPAVDPATGTLRVRAVFPNTRGLIYPGQFVRIRVPKQTHSRLLVPQSALQRDLSGYYLMVLGNKQIETPDGKMNTVPIAIRRNVEVGILQGELRVINEGIAAEDQVIVVGIQRARDDGPVTPQAGEIDEHGKVIRPGVSAPTNAAPDQRAPKPSAETPTENGGR